MNMRIGVRDLKIWQHRWNPAIPHTAGAPTAPKFSVLTGGIGVRGFYVITRAGVKGLITIFCCTMAYCNLNELVFIRINRGNLCKRAKKIYPYKCKRWNYHKLYLNSNRGFRTTWTTWNVQPWSSWIATNLPQICLTHTAWGYLDYCPIYEKKSQQ